jgi:hypothetical protein
VPNFFKFYGTFFYQKFVISVHYGIKQVRSLYENKEEINDDYLLCIYGPINKKHNLGKYLAKKSVARFAGMASAIYYSFLKYHPWNVAYEKKKQLEDE